MAEIKAIYEENRRTTMTLELRRRDLLVQSQKVQLLMNKLKLFGIFIKRWRKYNNYCGTQHPIKSDLIKTNYSGIYPEHKRDSDETVSKLKRHTCLPLLMTASKGNCLPNSCGPNLFSYSFKADKTSV